MVLQQLTNVATALKALCLPFIFNILYSPSLSLRAKVDIATVHRQISHDVVFTQRIEKKKVIKNWFSNSFLFSGNFVPKCRLRVCVLVWSGCCNICAMVVTSMLLMHLPYGHATCSEFCERLLYTYYYIIIFFGFEKGWESRKRMGS